MKEGWGKGVFHRFQFNDRVDELMYALGKKKELSQHSSWLKQFFVLAYFCGKLKPTFMPICDVKHKAKV